MILQPNSVAHVSVGRKVNVLVAYSLLNTLSAIDLRRLLKIVNLHNSTAWRRRRISSIQSSSKSVKLVLDRLVRIFVLGWVFGFFDGFFFVIDARFFLRISTVFNLQLDLVLMINFFFMVIFGWYSEKQVYFQIKSSKSLNSSFVAYKFSLIQTFYLIK